MEVYAAFLSHTDHQVGRLLDAVRKTGQWDNSLVFYIVGDNGGSAEGTLDGSVRNIASFFGTRDDVATQLAHIDELGGPLHDNHYAVPWAWATNSPFQWTKQVASHFGGTRNPLVVSWPARIKQAGGLRSQFHHVNDVAPTIYEAAGITFPETVDGVAQIPLEGNSLVYSFDDPDAPETHKAQYFEMFGNRAIYKDGWLAGARHGLPWELQGRKDDFENDRWELYHVAEDFSQAHDLAAQYPDKLKALQAEFDKEARRNNVYPLSAGLLDNLHGGDGPSLAKGRSSFVYTAGSVRIPDATAPRLEGRAHRIVATVDIPPAGAEGVLVVHGGRFGGYSLYLKDGRLVYETNTLGRNRHVLTSTVPVPAGRVELGFEFQPDGNSGKSGIGRLFVNGQPAGEAHLAGIGSLRAALTETFDVGEERGSVVSNAYAAPYRFTGTLEKLTVDLQ
jgi:arylsulfatase